MRIVFHGLNNAIVVTFLVHLEDFGSINRERTIDINVDWWQYSLVVEIVEHVHDFLCTANAERWYYELSATLYAGVVYDIVQVEFRLPVLLVYTISVCCLGYEDVCLRERHRWLHNPIVRTSNIAGVGNASYLAIFFKCNVYHGATEHVTAICEAHCYALIHLVVLVVRHRDENLHALFGIHVGVYGVHSRKTLLEKFLVVLLDIEFLNESRVWKHYRTEILGGRRTYHLAVEAILINIRYKSCMIDMSMRHKHIVNF